MGPWAHESFIVAGAERGGIAGMLIQLGDVTVAVRADSPAVRAMLAEFYPVAADGAAEPAWTVTAVVASVPAGVGRNPYGVGFQADATARAVTLWSPDERHLAITARKCVREVFLDRCEQAGHTMLHASAIYRDDEVVLFAADKRGGKTTLALRAVREHGWGWLSNDHLIVYRDGADLVATSLPTPIPVKVGTVVELAHLLPPPWDGNGVDVAAWRAAPAAHRHAAEAAVYFTFGRFGQPNPVLAPLTGRRVTVVFPHYVGPGEPAERPRQLPAGAVAGELARHVRVDWAGDDRLRQRHLAYAFRDAAAFASDGADLAAQVAAAADTALRWGHQGDPAPLLAALACTGGAAG
jgi:hypothetical protein